ncbi:hypothetical protein BH09PSE5_BH09PSE5_44160 [soil metagenome]
MWWTLRTQQGTTTLLRMIPGVQVLSPTGALWGDFSAQRVEIELSPAVAGQRGDHIVLTNVSWRGLTLKALPGGPPWMRLRFDELKADDIDVVIGPNPDPTPAAPRPPRSLTLPVTLEIASLQAGTVRATPLGDSPLRDLRARVNLGANPQGEHQLDDLSVTWGKLLASGSVHVGAVAPMNVTAKVDVRQVAVAPPAAASAPATSASGPTPLADWTASLQAQGPLERPAVQATLRAQGQSLDARATVLPFAAWPLAELDASVQALDLSAIHADAPVTSLSGTARAETTGRADPVGVKLELRNDVAGRWNEARLPLRSLTLNAQARPSDPSTVELHAFDAVLGTRSEDGGRIAGSGEWRNGDWSLDAALHEVQPTVLDSRMSAMRLSGPVTASGRGFASAATTVASGASAPSSAASVPRIASTPAGSPIVAAVARPTIQLHTELSGRVQLPGATRRAPPTVRAVELHVDATANDQRIELSRVEAISGGARATLRGTATRREATAPWQVDARLGLSQFDPTPWWIGPADSAWREGPHRLNADAVIDLSVPASLTDAGARPASLESRLAGLRGRVALNIAPSVLSGVAISGSAKVASIAPAGTFQADVALDAAGNTVAVNGQLTVVGNGASDRWQLDVKAPALASLAPMLRLTQQSGSAPLKLAGGVQANALLQGRWPAVSTSGQLGATALAYGTSTLANADARWQLGTAPDAALDLQADLSGASSGTQRIESVNVQLKGTASSHTLQLRALAKALPPEWVDNFSVAAGTGATPVRAAEPIPGARPASLPSSAGAASADAPASASAAASAATSTSTGAARPPQRGTVAVLTAEGGFIGNLAQPAAVAGWRGRLTRLDVSDSTGASAPWAHVDPVDIEFNTNAPAPRATLSAGRADILGAGLRWSRIAWVGGTQPQLDAQAELEPLSIAPILARLQPAFGWAGDLRIAGRLQVRSTPQLTANVDITRAGGDLRVNDDLTANPLDNAPRRGSQALGITNLRIAAEVQNGTWRFTQALTSGSLGTVSGAQTVRATPQAMWPEPASPIDGTLNLQLANLGSLSPWIPAGWRLSGNVESNARISGRFDSPEYTGQMKGSGLGVRNLLEGVNMSEGNLLIALQGETARIERFDMKAGKGIAKLVGGATFGTAPKADVTLTAERFEVLGRVDRRIVVSGNAALKIDPTTLALDGSFRLDEGLIDFSRSDAPSLSEDVTVIRTSREPGTGAPMPGEPPKARNIAVNVRFDLGDNLRIKGRGIDTGLGGDLRITSPGGRMAVNGTIGTIGGTYQAYGQKLSIDRGILVFSGPVDNPRLDIEAIRPDTDMKVGVQVTGPALTPRVRLYSATAMSDTDKLSWLLLGRAPDGLGRSDSALLQRAAMGLLAGESGGGSNSLVKSLGLDDVSVSQTDGAVKETVVALGKQISQRWYIGYERSLTGTTGSWQLVYRLAQRFTLRAQAGGDSSLDAIWTWRWD